MSNFVSFNCPVCRKRLKVDRQLVSKRLQCTRCNDIFFLKKVSREEYLEYEQQFQEREESSSLIDVEDSGIFEGDQPVKDLA